MRPDMLAVVGLGAVGGSVAWQASLAGTRRVLGFTPCDCAEIEAEVRALRILTRSWYGQGPCLRLDLVKEVVAEDAAAGR